MKRHASRLLGAQLLVLASLLTAACAVEARQPVRTVRHPWLRETVGQVGPCREIGPYSWICRDASGVVLGD